MSRLVCHGSSCIVGSSGTSGERSRAVELGRIGRQPELGNAEEVGACPVACEGGDAIRVSQALRKALEIVETGVDVRRHIVFPVCPRCARADRLRLLDKCDTRGRIVTVQHSDLVGEHRIGNGQRPLANVPANGYRCRERRGGTKLVARQLGHRLSEDFDLLPDALLFLFIGGRCHVAPRRSTERRRFEQISACAGATVLIAARGPIGYRLSVRGGARGIVCGYVACIERAGGHGHRRRLRTP
mmetsp:Transcript_3411/g.9978  ORF Transcript_3411/g.9978 Transcript_3411/m.9978 type:complete len:243 (+) Transcript_3411:268-996(+)